jgi:hypothetical protein
MSLEDDAAVAGSGTLRPLTPPSRHLLEPQGWTLVFERDVAPRIGSDAARLQHNVAKPTRWLFLQDGGDVQRNPDLVAD